MNTLEVIKLVNDAIESDLSLFNIPKTARMLEAVAALNQAIEQAQKQEPVKLWLWKNFVDGRPEYWAFNNAYPINLDDGDPQTLGEPCGYAWLKPSRQGRFDVSDEEVLRSIENAKESTPQQKQEPVAMQMDVIVVNLVREGINKHRARELAEHFIKHTSPPQRQPLTDEQILKMWGEETSCDMPDNLVQFKHTIRVAEAAHGIKEKNT